MDRLSTQPPKRDTERSPNFAFMPADTLVAAVLGRDVDVMVMLLSAPVGVGPRTANERGIDHDIEPAFIEMARIRMNPVDLEQAIYNMLLGLFASDSTSPDKAIEQIQQMKIWLSEQEKPSQ